MRVLVGLSAIFGYGEFDNADVDGDGRRTFPIAVGRGEYGGDRVAEVVDLWRNLHISGVLRRHYVWAYAGTHVAWTHGLGGFATKRH